MKKQCREDRNIQFKCYEFRNLIKNHQNLQKEIGLGSGMQKQWLPSMVLVGKAAAAAGNSSLTEIHLRAIHM